MPELFLTLPELQNKWTEQLLIIWWWFFDYYTNEPSATPIRGFLFSEDAAKGNARGTLVGNAKGNAILVLLCFACFYMFIIGHRP